MLSSRASESPCIALVCAYGCTHTRTTVGCALPDTGGRHRQVVNSSWTQSQRVFPNLAASSAGALLATARLNTRQLACMHAHLPLLVCMHSRPDEPHENTSRIWLGTIFVVGGNAAFDQFFANIYASDDGGSTWRDLTSASATATGKKVRSEKSRVDTNHTQPNFAHKGAHARTHAHAHRHTHTHRCCRRRPSTAR